MEHSRITIGPVDLDKIILNLRFGKAIVRFFPVSKWENQWKWSEGAIRCPWFEATLVQPLAKTE